MDSACLLSSTPEIGILHAVLQMIRRGQKCEFCHIESHGKKTVKSLINMQSTSFFLHIELTYTVGYLYQPVSFQKLVKILQNGALVTIAPFFDSPRT